MRFSDVLPQMINEGKMYTRDAWYTQSDREAYDRDPDYVIWQKGYPQGIPINQNTAEATGLPEGTLCFFSPYMMRHFGGNRFAPYQLTQEDLAATDWEPFVRGDHPNPVVVGYNFEEQPAIHVNRCKGDGCGGHN